MTDFPESAQAMQNIKTRKKRKVYREDVVNVSLFLIAECALAVAAYYFIQYLTAP